MVLFMLVFLLIFLIVLCYYIKRVYFTLYGPIPGIPPQFLFGNLLQTGFIGRNVPFNLIFLDLQAKFGDIFQYWLGPTRLILVNRLEDVQHIFSHRNIYDQGDMFIDKVSLINPYAILCMRGPSYKRHFSIVSPLFRRNKLNAYLDPVIDCTDKLLTRWRTYYNDPKEIHLNMIEQSQQLLLAIFGYVAFDYDFQTLEDEYNTNKNELTDALHIHLDSMITCIQLPSILDRIYLFLNIKYRQSQSIIDRYLQQMIEQELRETPETRAKRKRTSLIASLVDSLQQDEQLEAKKSEETKKGLSRDEVVGEMLSFLSAGYATTSTSLVWFIFLMSKHPNVQNKLKKELSQNDLQRLSIEQLDSLVYLDCVLRELFRFVPPIIGTMRTLVADDQLPGTGVHLKKGDQVMIPFYNLNRDERHSEGPIPLDQFYPERFLNENSNKIPLMTFGGGHRQCIGQDFARLELKAICARLMQHVSFGDGGEKLNAGGYKQTDTILPKHIGVTIIFD